jgi:ATP-dependent DNA helicase
MHQQNVVMQLRKVCSHPSPFEGPRMHQHLMDEELVDASGKMMMVLEKLLDAVLVFSQLVTMVDVMEVSDPLFTRLTEPRFRG